MTSWRRGLASLGRIAFDSNALIYAVEGTAPYAPLVAELLARMALGEAEGIVSTVVELEVLVKPLRAGDRQALDEIALLFEGNPNLGIRAVDRAVAHRAAGIRARTRLGLADSIIVATALEERCDAIIGNDAQVASRATGIPYLCLDDYLV